jgi:hypothetical protein
MTPPPFSYPIAAKPVFDPVRFCAMTTVALIAWVLGPPACVMIMSAIGLVAYTRAVRGGLRESRCVLRRPALVLGYLALTFAAGAFALVRQLLA